MIIGACGYGATGSSVISDLLQEYEEIQVFDTFESWWSYRVDGLEDLEYHLMKQYAKGESCDAAIRRFLRKSKSYMVPFIHKPCNGKKFYELSRQFIDKITQFQFRGCYTSDVCTGYVMRDFFAFASKKIFMPKVIEKIVGKQVYLWPCAEKYFAVEPENFYDAAKAYTSAVLEAMGADLNKPVCLDQPFSGNNPQDSFKFFDDPYAVVVDRDPRDLYLMLKFSKHPDGKFIPTDDVDKFIVYYRNLRKHKAENSRVLYIRFEDMIYNYEESVRKIESFLSIHNHVRVKQVFNPARSINNTQLIRLHPEEKENVKKIESNLREFLYNFEQFGRVIFQGRPFEGAARKSIED